MQAIRLLATAATRCLISYLKKYGCILRKIPRVVAGCLTLFAMESDSATINFAATFPGQGKIVWYEAL